MSRGALTEARHVVLPDGIVSSGLPAARKVCAELGIDLDPWQVGTARCILAKDSTGHYAADTVALSIPRQVGKTFLVGALVFADAIINPGTTTVWTAHRFKVARETFNELRSIATSPPLAPHIDPDDITTAAGNECIPFRNGSRIVFAARERGAIRGFTKVRRLILDEAQILTESAMADLSPTMNQAVNPQMVLMGTPPKPNDPSESFTSIRDDALSGRSEGTVYVEFSAEDTADLDDRAAWREANPSFPKRTPAKAILRMRKLLTDDDFAREALGVWGGSESKRVIDDTTWRLLADELSQPLDRMALSLDTSPDQSMSSVSMAGQRADGRWHVEVIDNRAGTGWVPRRVADLQGRHGFRAVVVDPEGPAGFLIESLEEQGVTVTRARFREVKTASALFYAAAFEDALRHIDQPQLNAGLAGARRRDVGDGWVWNRKNVTVDLTPVVSCTLALWGAQSENVAQVSRPSAVFAF